ncbi:YciI family protein [Undibacterium cyanobacteriorum]|uniref:YciI family protein n=1 Tax=Undibacterium cyanobacteriorum TaxID=3073561 RepID=A0ABY9RCU3_9BURK|nr:YciI family protein [Undibacterium sp. 20NA77.5]WMW79072.1 YciI family protein [Undibacterium sp. 20NA77.5]
MLFVIRFHDKPETQEIRKALLPSHLAWLDQHKESILVGGSLRVSPEQSPVGGLWIAQAQCKEELMALIESDPFWIADLRLSVEILHWSKAFDDRQVLV